MALKIFQTDPDAAPKERTSSDIVGRFRAGQQINGKPHALQEWRVTTSDPDVADRIAELLGGTPEDWETKSAQNIEVLTSAHEVRIILEAPRGVHTDLGVKGGDGKLIRRCDGVTQLGCSDDDPAKGKDCQCPEDYQGRKAAADKGWGCSPNIAIYFVLEEDSGLGKFAFYSQSWNFAKELVAVEEELESLTGPIAATFGLEVISFTAKDGTPIRYTKPYLKLDKAKD